MTLASVAEDLNRTVWFKHHKTLRISLYFFVNFQTNETVCQKAYVILHLSLIL